VLLMSFFHPPVATSGSDPSSLFLPSSHCREEPPHFLFLSFRREWLQYNISFSNVSFLFFVPVPFYSPCRLFFFPPVDRTALNVPFLFTLLRWCRIPISVRLFSGCRFWVCSMHSYFQEDARSFLVPGLGIFILGEIFSLPKLPAIRKILSPKPFRFKKGRPCSTS